MSRTPSVLFQNEDKSVILLDLPKSLEEGQVLSNELHGDREPRLRRLISTAPPEEPFKLPEPKKQSFQHAPDPAAQVAELMTLARVNAALEEIQQTYSGPWCHPRTYDESRPSDSGEGSSQKRKSMSMQSKCSNDQVIPPESPRIMTPKDSHYLEGTIRDRRQDLIETAPLFDLILMDPPWPNRSARRKQRGSTYTTADGLSSTRDLLANTPVRSKLGPDGLVAVWVTNNHSYVDLLTSPRNGIFAEWGVELVDTWTWLKVTTTGEPIFDVESQWRKPWERLLLARRVGSPAPKLSSGGKVIVTVPDAHSRKPCLRSLLECALPTDYTALEVFARNLTAGWWSWGDQVLMFQAPQHWHNPDHDEPGSTETSDSRSAEAQKRCRDTS
ncbi:uncharacterized protein E0L32_008523 [Thyridium curvatum]|uniref:MT-A70-domain-containing protein n=1 Tax=Thyridium curvatum TaxID=1093900 RepID=A0A507ARN4_9PEZI|nr:uncharacterized protein E0L32_008523 [Thyridium curvatum]TPX10473.1 hypothetical protein E0L32_008523 [Thyridium curvatum]